MISTRNLSNLPKPEDLRQLLQALAMVDAILEDEWEYRYYSFDSKWSRARFTRCGGHCNPDIWMNT